MDRRIRIRSAHVTSTCIPLSDSPSCEQQIEHVLSARRAHAADADLLSAFVRDGIASTGPMHHKAARRA
eukprot:256170-Prymnesium_polylepis.1